MNKVNNSNNEFCDLSGWFKCQKCIKFSDGNFYDVFSYSTVYLTLSNKQTSINVTELDEQEIEYPLIDDLIKMFKTKKNFFIWEINVTVSSSV